MSEEETDVVETLWANSHQLAAYLDVNSGTISERSLRIALEDERFDDTMKGVLHRHLRAQFPEMRSRQLFDVGKLPGNKWRYKGCHKLGSLTNVTVLPLRHHSDVTQILNSTVARQRMTMGIVRWSSEDSVLVMPSAEDGQLIQEEEVDSMPLRDVECSLAGYTACENKLDPPVEIYSRIDDVVLDSEEERHLKSSNSTWIKWLTHHKVALLCLLIVAAVLLVTVFIVNRYSWHATI